MKYSHNEVILLLHYYAERAGLSQPPKVGFRWSSLRGVHLEFIERARTREGSHPEMILLLHYYAERAGFEPAVQLPVRQFSKLVVSATHPSLQMSKELGEQN